MSGRVRGVMHAASVSTGTQSSCFVSSGNVDARRCFTLTQLLQIRLDSAYTATPPREVCHGTCGIHDCDMCVCLPVQLLPNLGQAGVTVRDYYTQAVGWSRAATHFDHLPRGVRLE